MKKDSREKKSTDTEYDTAAVRIFHKCKGLHACLQ